MPLPNLKLLNNEKDEEFIKRCMTKDQIKKEFPDRQQRLGYCYSQLEKAKRQKNEK